ACRFGESCRYVHDANENLGNNYIGSNRGRGATVDTTNELLSKLLQQLGTLTTNTTSSSNFANTCVPTVLSPGPNAFLVGPSHLAGPITSPVTPPGFPAQPMAHTPYCYHGLPPKLAIAPSPSMAQLGQPTAHTSLPTP
ncbi:ribonuclease H-like domain-containing protein, partial [Tanacetum coccineum]